MDSDLEMGTDLNLNWTGMNWIRRDRMGMCDVLRTLWLRKIMDR
jgi:hypothetical protein